MCTLLNKFDRLVDLNSNKAFHTSDGLQYKYIRTTPLSEHKVEIEIEVNYQRIIFRSDIDNKLSRLDYFVKLQYK